MVAGAHMSGLKRSLMWIDHHMNTFVESKNIFRGGELENLKHCSELVLMCGVLLSLKIEEAWAKATLNRLWSVTFDCGNVFRDVLVVRPDMVAVVSTYANFRDAGYENRTVSEMCDQISKCNWIDVLPMPAWRHIDILNSMDRLGIRSLSFSDIRRCWVTSRPPICVIPTEIAYAITHEIFYISDFGRAKGRVDAALSQYLHVALPIWQKHFLNEGDLDLYAEFLLCGKFALGLIDTNAMQECLRRQASDGSFKGPERVRKTVGVANDGLDDFRCDYHTTLVMCALLASYQEQ
jgi:hypothetical protein